MQLFEVIFPLESGYNLNVLMAGADAAGAKLEAMKVLASAGCVLALHVTNPESITARAVTIEETARLPAPAVGGGE